MKKKILVVFFLGACLLVGAIRGAGAATSIVNRGQLPGKIGPVDRILNGDNYGLVYVRSHVFPAAPFWNYKWEIKALDYFRRHLERGTAERLNLR